MQWAWFGFDGFGIKDGWEQHVQDLNLLILPQNLEEQLEIPH